MENEKQKKVKYVQNWRKVKANMDKFNEYQKKYRILNVVKKRKQMLDYSNSLKSAIFEILGKECAICGFSDNRALQIDHINGGGNLEKKSITKNYYKFVLGQIVKNDRKYQILCANCNWIKRSNNKETRKVK